MAGSACLIHIQPAAFQLRQRRIQRQLGNALAPGSILRLILVLLAFLVVLPADLNAASKPSRPDGGLGNAPLQGSTPNPGYRLGPNDVIKVEVFGEDELTTETRVSGDGKIGVPLLGVLEIKGLTVKETEELIAKRLSEGFFKNPRVSIYITKYRNFFVTGEVKSPGGYPYEEGLTVLKAVTLAGGFSDKAAKGRVKIKRLKGSEEETIPVKLEDTVLPDDIIVVPESFF